MHLLFAFLVTLHIFLLARRILGTNDETQRSASSIALGLLGLLAVQLMLGTGAFFARTHCFRRNVRNWTHGDNYNRPRRSRGTYVG